ncbi:MAG: ABC transporter permease, partial [Candidatus Hodarchaeota archaeon]
VVLGSISGYYGGLVDEFFMRFTDVIISIPGFFLLLLALSVFADSIRDMGAWGAPTIIALLLGILGWAGVARIVRAEFLAMRQLEYAEAARVLGASDRRIIFRHLLPNAMAPVIVTATIGMAGVILSEAGLAFLGLGNPQTPSWGRMLQLAQLGMRFAWWAALIPGLAIFFAVFAFNMLGDALRDALDPRLKE